MVSDRGRVERVDVAEEEMLERVAAIDVGKDSGMVCQRFPDPARPAHKLVRTWSVRSTTADIGQLAQDLAADGVQRVVMESTADYWRPFFYVLEAYGITVWLVNARDVKNVPGRPKTDKLDAMWLARLNERGMLRPSFVPPPPIRVLRDYTRMRVDLTADRTRVVQRVQMLLEDALIKLSTIASDIMGKSGRAILQALVAGERDPQVLADRGNRLHAGRATKVAALTGRFDDHHGDLVQVLMSQVDGLDEQIRHLDQRIDELIAAMPDAQAPTCPPGMSPTDQAPLAVVERLDEITGIGRVAAQAIIAEIGLDMSVFPTGAHLTSWAKLAPMDHQSGRWAGTRGTGKGNPYLKRALANGAAAAGRTGSKTFLGARYQRIRKRRGTKRALVAISRSILLIVWRLLSDPTARFHDLGPNFYQLHVHAQRRKNNYIHQLESLGYKVTIEPLAA